MALAYFLPFLRLQGLILGGLQTYPKAPTFEEFLFSLGDVVWLLKNSSNSSNSLDQKDDIQVIQAT